MVNVCDIAISELKIGQVVKFPNHYAVIVQITLQIGGHWLDWDSVNYQSQYNHQRYSTITYLVETGRVVSPMFHMNNDYALVNRVILENEIYKFNEIVQQEKNNWVLLEINT